LLKVVFWVSKFFILRQPGLSETDPNAANAVNESQHAHCGTQLAHRYAHMYPGAPGCGVPRDVVYPEMWCTPGCGVPRDVVYPGMWCTPGCGVPRDVVYPGMWCTPGPGDVVYSGMWCTPGCGVPRDVVYPVALSDSHICCEKPSDRQFADSIRAESWQLLSPRGSVGV